jgi:hypothetical protein
LFNFPAQREKAEKERLEKEAAGEDKDEGDAEKMVSCFHCFDAFPTLSSTATVEI